MLGSNVVRFGYKCDVFGNRAVGQSLMNILHNSIGRICVREGADAVKGARGAVGGNYCKMEDFKVDYDVKREMRGLLSSPDVAIVTFKPRRGLNNRQIAKASWLNAAQRFHAFINNTRLDIKREVEYGKITYTVRRVSPDAFQMLLRESPFLTESDLNKINGVVKSVTPPGQSEAEKFFSDKFASVFAPSMKKAVDEIHKTATVDNSEDAPWRPGAKFEVPKMTTEDEIMMLERQLMLLKAKKSREDKAKKTREILDRATAELCELHGCNVVLQMREIPAHPTRLGL